MTLDDQYVSTCIYHTEWRSPMLIGNKKHCSPGAEGGPVCNYMSPNFDS